MCRRGGGARASWGRARSVEGRERLDAAGLAAEIGPLTIPDRITPSDAAEHQTACTHNVPPNAISAAHRSVKRYLRRGAALTVHAFRASATAIESKNQ